jgi:NAD(P)-dependent dehydrogenase (short-subunit alcohol dehydrogenase family)
MSKHVLITGIHTGLGHALARRCLEQGDRVLALSRVLPEDLADQEGLTFRALDLRRTEEIPDAVNVLLTGLDSIDLAVLNAGVLGEIKDLHQTSLEELRDVMDINVWANKVLIDALIAHHAPVNQIVAISSGAAFNGSGGWGAYSISKSALNLLIRVYAHEHPGTHFIALAPGVVETAMIRYILARPEDPRYGANGRIRKAAAEGRILDPETAAANILARVTELRRHSSGTYVDIREF